MIQVITDGKLTYDSRLTDYALSALKRTTGLNKGGTATITMPPSHPARNSYYPHKSIVEIYRDSTLLFRGRALPPSDDVYNRRTITCEGERCFFRDAVSRPYLYEGTPAEVFTAIMNTYNSQVDETKRFKIGAITVTDPNGAIKLENQNAEKVSATIDKLQQKCGGYIVFTTDPQDSKRVVNWYATLSYKSRQTIDCGANLLDYTRDGAGTEPITAVLPYGAVDKTTDTRITIESVNDGQDYIQDDEAVALFGFKIEPVIWEDAESPESLLSKARQHLEEHRYIVTALRLSALDLSYLDKSIDTFQVGDTVRVVSKPHEVDEDFLLTERTDDLLNPAKSTISLGKDRRTLTSADVAGDNKGSTELHRVSQQIKADYLLNIAKAVEATEQTLSTLIQQTSESIKMEVSEKYTSNDQLTEALSTTMTQLSDQFLFEFNSLRSTIDGNDAEARELLDEIYRYISFEGGAIKLGASNSAITLTIENDMIVFKKNGVQFGWWDGTDFHTGNIVVEVNERAQFGNFAFVPRSNGSLSFLKVGG